MGPDWWEIPTPAELEREAWEEHQRETYEDRFLGFCGEHYLDPEDTRSVLVYELWWERHID